MAAARDYLALAGELTDDQRAAFLAKVGTPDPLGCSLWQGYSVRGSTPRWVVRRNGTVDAFTVRTLAYALAGHAVPHGHVIVPMCGNRTCCAADHFEVITRSEQGRRHHDPCAQGHALTEANTIWCTDRGRTYRRCRLCRTAWTRNYLATQKTTKENTHAEH